MIILVSWHLVAEIRGKDMADKKQKNDISKLSFEEAIKELTEYCE